MTSVGYAYPIICDAKGYTYDFEDGADNLADYLERLDRGEETPSVLVIGDDGKLHAVARDLRQFLNMVC